MSDFIFSIEPLKCLRRDYADNDCSICINLCPEKAIIFKRGKISIDESLCTACHGCVGVCPTEAIESAKFEPNFFVAKEISLEKNELKQKLLSDTLRLSCKELGVCLCVFDKSHLIALGMKSSRKLEADISICGDCELNKSNKLKIAIDDTLDETNNFLKEFANRQIERKTERSKDRRAFLKALFKKTASAVESFDESGAQIEKPKTKLPLKRILLKNAVKEGLDDANRFIENNYSFSTSKKITKECTNCKSCVEFCPTNALFYSNDFSKIYFQSGKCIDCDICNDICAPKAFVDGFEKDMSMFAFDKAATAIEHNLIVCRSCKMAFSSKEGEETCPKCEEYKNDFSHMFMTAAEIEVAEKKS